MNRAPGLSPEHFLYVNRAYKWTAVKIRWQLSIGAAEQQALTASAAACPTQHVPTTDDHR
ncbi:hypothetical protein [Nonomuraea sp. NPDC049400]|uniref:hypothetical protein n=1 Tax=Nonomuraea sp. NPDC049400 TaxID=3364352 RepID=UPI0037AD4DB0